MSTRPLQRNPTLRLSKFGFGGAPLGELFVRVSETQAEATLQRAWDSGIRYYDTSPFYGHGKSEHRLGHFLRQQDRSEFVLSTKVGRVFSAAPGADFDPSPWSGGLPFRFHFDYSYDGIMRSWEDSLQRLGLERVDILFIHDLDPQFQPGPNLDRCRGQLEKSGWKALEELRSSGAVGAIGAGINCLGMIPWFLESGDPDLFLVAMPYTLLDQKIIEEEFPSCESRGINIVVGAVFASGILVTGPTPEARYAYEPAPEPVLERTRRIQEVCAKHSIALPAAALQFPLAHPIVASIIPGALCPEHLNSNLAHLDQAIPPAFWEELQSCGILNRAAPVPRGASS